MYGGLLSDRQVMLLKNNDTAKGLVNGATGEVIGFEPNRGASYKHRFPTFPIVRFSSTVSGVTSTFDATIEPSEWDITIGNRSVCDFAVLSH